MAFKTWADKVCFSSVEVLLTSSIIVLTTSSLTTATTCAIRSASSCEAPAFWTAVSARVSICSLLFSDKVFSLSVSFSEIPEMTFKDKLVSVVELFTSSIILEPVSVLVLTIISEIILVISCVCSIPVPSCWFCADTIVWAIMVSLTSSLIISILPESLSTIAFKTLADKVCLSSVEVLLTSSTTLLTNSSLAPATTFAIRFASSCEDFASSTADTVNFWICSWLFWAKISNFSGFFSEKSAITFNDNLESSLLFFSVILFITDDIVSSSDLAITLLKIDADLSVSFATIVSKIFSFINPALSEVEVVINSLSLSERFPTTPSTNVSLVSIIFSIVSPIFCSSDWSITSDKKVVFSSLLFSTMKSMFCFFSSLIISFAASISVSSTMPSLFASWRFPFVSFSWSCSVNSFSSIFETFTKVSFTDFNSCFSSSDCSRWVTSFDSATSTTWSVFVKLVVFPSDEIAIWPTLPKLSSARATSELPFGFIFALNLVPLIPRDIFERSISISPFAFFAIEPDSIIIFPLPTFALNFSFPPEFSNSLIFKDVNSFNIIVVLSLNWIVADEFSPIKILSFKNI